MMRRELTRPGIRPVITGLAVIVALLLASVPVASADGGHSGAPVVTCRDTAIRARPVVICRDTMLPLITTAAHPATVVTVAPPVGNGVELSDVRGRYSSTVIAETSPSRKA